MDRQTPKLSILRRCLSPLYEIEYWTDLTISVQSPASSASVHIFSNLKLLLILVCIGAALTGCRDLAEAEANDSMTLADQALEEENWEKADELFHEIILLDPTRAEAWVGRGMALTYLKPPEEARDHYEEALRLYTENLQEDPKSKRTWRHRVMILVFLNRREEALVTAAEGGQTLGDVEFAHELVDSVSRTALEYPEMILPPEDAPESATP